MRRLARRLLAWILTALAMSLAVTLALAWSAAVILPPNNLAPAGANRHKAERWIFENGFWQRQQVYSDGTSGSVLAFAAHIIGSSTYRFDGGDAFPPPSRGGKPPRKADPSASDDLPSMIPPGTLRILMPWFEPSRPDPALDAQERHLYCYGWPLPAVGQVRNFNFLPDGTFPTTIEGCVDLPPWFTRGRNPPMFSVWTLPIWPIWPGLIVNTLAAIPLSLGVLWLAAALLTRVRARRPGCCPHCGYSRTGIAPTVVCPECGQALGPPKPPAARSRAMA